MSEKVFVKGLWIEAPHEKAPDFVLHDISIKCTDLYAFLQEHKNDKGYVNIQVLRSREGKPYAVLNDWKPDQTKGTQEAVSTDNNSEEEIPF